jgi:hypothetical protein
MIGVTFISSDISVFTEIIVRTDEIAREPR